MGSERVGCEFMGCSMLGHYTDPKLDGKMYCQHHREVMMRGLKDSKIQRQAEALDVAEYAFEFMISKGCNCASVNHQSTCHVLAAKNALDAIKEKLGDQ